MDRCTINARLSKLYISKIIESKAEACGEKCQTFSRTMAIPCPTPIHMVQSAFFAVDLCN